MEPLAYNFEDALNNVREFQKTIDNNKLKVASALKSIERLDKDVAALSNHVFIKACSLFSGNEKPVRVGVAVAESMHLPSEIIEMIFTYLNPKDLVQVRKVCRQWNAICDEKKFQAYAYLLKNFPNVDLNGCSWKSVELVTKQVRPLNVCIDRGKFRVARINKHQNVLLVVNGVTIVVSAIILAPHLKKGLQNLGKYMEESHNNAVKAIMNANPGMKWEEAEGILRDQIRNISDY